MCCCCRAQWHPFFGAWPLDRMEALLRTLVEIDRLVKAQPFAEANL